MPSVATMATMANPLMLAAAKRMDCLTTRDELELWATRNLLCSYERVVDNLFLRSMQCEEPVRLKRFFKSMSLQLYGGS